MAKTSQPVHFTPTRSTLQSLGRRQLLKGAVVIGGSFAAGTGFLASSNAAWAVELEALTPEAMATLIQMARDIYPHDRFGDELYAAAVKGHDAQAAENPEFKSMLEAGVAALDAQAQQAGAQNYIDLGWEADRNTILKFMESETDHQTFFQTIRGGLVVGLYNQPAVWTLLGYEGSSFEKGGYLDRGFDDIDWV